MPDGAFEATERQFLRLLEVSSGSGVVEVSRHTMDGVPRGAQASARVVEVYAPLAAIRDEPPDLLIVTGSNPVEPRLQDEPYWNEMVDLLSWASYHVPTMLLSCLSAHAALAIFDGIERIRLATKCTGVFTHDADASALLSVGLDAQIQLPHSRTNTVPIESVIDAGYAIPIQSSEVGWAVATRKVASSNVVLVQGHPEYEPTSLLREYHRDARRYVLHERDDLPVLPVDCVAPGDWEQLERLHTAIVTGERDKILFESYPFNDVGDRAPWPWQTTATRLYTNLLTVGSTKLL